MTETPFPTAPQIRERVLDALVLFEHADELSALRPDATQEAVSFELCRLWFDRVYAPGLRYMDGIKGDHDPAAAEAFTQAFTEEENVWLERFNRFLELRVDRLSACDRKTGEFPRNDTWAAIRRDAGNLVALLDPERRRRKRTFAAALRELKSRNAP